jgi:hypothetical protein
MTSRQRILPSLDHREPDRIPIDLSGHRSSGIAAVAYPKLRQYLGMPPQKIRVYDPIQQLAVLDGDVLDRFGVDTIGLGRGFALDESDWADWTLPDGTPCKMPAWALPERRPDAGAALQDRERLRDQIVGNPGRQRVHGHGAAVGSPGDDLRAEDPAHWPHRHGEGRDECEVATSTDTPPGLC